MNARRASISVLVLAVLALAPVAAHARAITWQQQAYVAHVVKDIDRQPVAWTPSGFTQVGSEILFTASTSSQHPLLWETRGNVATTHLLKHEDHMIANPLILGASAGFGYFSTSDGRGGAYLWKTNGSAAETIRLRDIRPRAAGETVAPYDFTPAKDHAYFLTGGQAGDLTLWVTDGTTSNTRHVIPVNPGTGQFGMSGFEQMVAIGDEVYFTSTTPPREPSSGRATAQ